MSNNRILTVTSSYTPKSSTLQMAKEPAPKSYLRLRGNWLRDAGFKPGSKVNISVKDGQLIIDVKPNK